MQTQITPSETGVAPKAIYKMGLGRKSLGGGGDMAENYYYVKKEINL